MLELAVEAQASVIVTPNVRDFRGIEKKFEIHALTPGALLLEMEGER